MIPRKGCNSAFKYLKAWFASKSLRHYAPGLATDADTGKGGGCYGCYGVLRIVHLKKNTTQHTTHNTTRHNTKHSTTQHTTHNTARHNTQHTTQHNTLWLLHSPATGKLTRAVAGLSHKPRSNCPRADAVVAQFLAFVRKAEVSRRCWVLLIFFDDIPFACYPADIFFFALSTLPIHPHIVWVKKRVPRCFTSLALCKTPWNLFQIFFFSGVFFHHTGFTSGLQSNTRKPTPLDLAVMILR